jgi:hypothetical protein
MPGDPKLSYQEMDTILKRSVELQARRGSTEFSAQDVLDAARELGINAHTAEEVVQVHLARRATAANLVPRPFNTRIRLEVSPDTFSLTIPPIRLSWGLLGSVAFSGGWLAAFAYWTSNAAVHDEGFALFSLAFWLALLGLVGSLALMLIRKTTLTLNRDVGELATTFGRRRALMTTELRVHIDDEESGNDDDDDDNGKTRKAKKQLRLEHGVDTLALLHGYSPQEQRWIESELRAWLQNV